MISIFYHQFIKRRNELESEIEHLQSELQKLPEGNFFISKNGNRYKWYRSISQKQIYIPKKEQSLAEHLALKKYLTLLLEDIQHELSAINRYLKRPLTNKSEDLLKHPEYQRLTSRFFQPRSQAFSDWMKQPYPSNPNPDSLIHKTITGYFVRSKSEVLIDMVLHNHKLPYRYECQLQLGEKTYYPDFTIRHPKTGEYFYYEHFGKMDDPDYVRKTCAKIEHYSSHGIIPSINLLMTFETKEHPLNIDVVERIVADYFL